MENSPKSFWGRLVAALTTATNRNYLLDFLQKNAIKMLIKNFAIAGGIKAWLITFVVDHLIDEADEHLIEPAFRAVGYIGDTLDGAKVYKKIKNAEDVETWVDAVNDI